MARIHPDDLGRIRSEVERQGNGDLGFKVTEYRERHADGHWIWILSRGKTVDWNSDGTPARMVGTDTDITSLKAIEEVHGRQHRPHDCDGDVAGCDPCDRRRRVAGDFVKSRFVDMWRVPQDALAAGADAPILASIASALRNPEAFNASVRHLHEHAEDTGTEELETIDGRTIERNTGALRLPDGAPWGASGSFATSQSARRRRPRSSGTARSSTS